MRGWGLAAGLAVFAAMFLSPPPSGLSLEGWRVCALLAMMICWWFSEALPLSVTALAPFIVLPLAGVGSVEEVARLYGSPLIFLVLGASLIAIAAVKCGLHRRLAALAVRVGGGGPRTLIFALMAATAFVAMWANAAVAMLFMLEIGLTVAAAALGIPAIAEAKGRDQQRFASALVVGLAFAATLGGLATMTGSAVNIAAVGVIERHTGLKIEFGEWLAIGLPIMLVGLMVAWGALVGAAFRFKLELPGREALLAALGEGGRLTAAQWRVLAVCAAAIGCWIGMPLLEAVAPRLTDPAVAMLGALILFALPGGPGQGRLLTWDDAKGAPWGVLLLVGGSLALAGVITETGVAAWMAKPLARIGDVPSWLALVVFVAGVIAVTEVAGNFAVMAVSVPAAVALAGALGEHPLVFAIAAALASSWGFINPAGQPWTAMAASTAPVRFGAMARSGLPLGLLGPLLIASVCLAVAALRGL
jgi:solute carrier family 13 (sodium-dependent dicarboxylate transporter), member 2/3/5